MKDLLLTIAIVLATYINVFSQSVHFYFTDGSVETYALADVSSFNFTDEVMNLHLINETHISWNTSIIQRYEYDDLNLSIGEESEVSKPSIKVFPNPSDGAVTITYTLKKATNVRIDIRDLSGKSISIMSGNRAAGMNTDSWNATDSSGFPVANGIYICSVYDGKMTMSRTLIISR